MSLLFFFSLAGYALLLKALLPKMKAGHALFVSFGFEMFMAYTLVIVFNLFVPAAYSLIGGGLASLVIALILLGIRYLKTGAKGKSLISDLCSGEIVQTFGLFFLLNALFLLLLGKGVLKGHDSLTYWARAPRELYVQKGSYFNGDTTFDNWDYIPMAAALQYCVTEVFGWSTKFLYYVIMGCFSSALCAMSACMPVPLHKKMLFCLLSCWAMPLMDYQYTTASLNADALLVLIFLTGVICWQCSEQNRNFVSSLPTICAAVVLPGIKIASGIMFAVVLFFMMAFSFRTVKRSLLSLFVPGLSLAGMLFVQLSWSGVYNYGVEIAAYEAREATAAYKGESFSEKAPAFNLSFLYKGNPRSRDLISGNGKGEALLSDLIKDGLDRLAGKKELYSISGNVIGWLALSILGHVLIYRKHRDPLVKKTDRILLIASILYLIGIIAALIVQPKTTSSVVRYNSLIFLLFVIPFYYYVCSGDFSMEKNGLFIVITAVLLLSDTNLYQLYGAYSAEPDQEFALTSHTKKICEEVKKVLLYDQRYLIIDNSKETAGLKSMIWNQSCSIFDFYMLPRKGRALYYQYNNFNKALDVPSMFDLTGEQLEEIIINNRTGMMYVKVANDPLCSVLTETTGIPIEPQQIYVIYVDYSDGALHYTLLED